MKQFAAILSGASLAAGSMLAQTPSSGTPTQTGKKTHKHHRKGTKKNTDQQPPATK